MRSHDYLKSKEGGDKARLWLEEIRVGTQPRPHLRLVPARAALIVVDMLRYFADPEGRCFLPAAASITKNIERILGAWRDAERPVFFTQHCHSGADDLGMFGKFFSDYIRKGEKEAEIISCLAPRTGERIVEKTTYDGFLGTGLADALRSLSCDQVVITGVLAHMCCETTARSAFCRGFEVYIPVDGVADSSEERHLQSLKGLADSVAIITSVEEVEGRCRGKIL